MVQTEKKLVTGVFRDRFDAERAFETFRLGGLDRTLVGLCWSVSASRHGCERHERQDARENKRLHWHGPSRGGRIPTRFRDGGDRRRACCPPPNPPDNSRCGACRCPPPRGWSIRKRRKGSYALGMSPSRPGFQTFLRRNEFARSGVPSVGGLAWRPSAIARWSRSRTRYRGENMALRHASLTTSETR